MLKLFLFPYSKNKEDNHITPKMKHELNDYKTEMIIMETNEIKQRPFISYVNEAMYHVYILEDKDIESCIQSIMDFGFEYHEAAYMIDNRMEAIGKQIKDEVIDTASVQETTNKLIREGFTQEEATSIIDYTADMLNKNFLKQVNPFSDANFYGFIWLLLGLASLFAFIFKKDSQEPEMLLLSIIFFKMSFSSMKKYIQTFRENIRFLRNYNF